MNSMNLNIHNYSVMELKELFNIPETYNEIDVEMSTEKLKERINSRTNVDIQIKNDTLQFLEQAKAVLKEPKNMLSSGNIVVKNPEKINRKEQYLFHHAENMFPKKVNDPAKTRPALNINIDTRFRPNYYITEATNFTLNLPYKLRGVTSISLSNAGMEDAMFYNVTKEMGNNFFWIHAYGPNYNPDISNNLQPSQYEETCVFVNDGAYSTDNIISLINQFLQNLTSSNYLQYLFLTGNSPFSGGTGQQVIFGISSNYYTRNNLGPSSEMIQNTPNFTFSLDFQANRQGDPDLYTPLPSKMGWALGFRNGLYVNNSTYLSEASCTMTGPRYFYVCMDDGQVNYQNSWMNAFTNSMVAGNLLARISVPSTRSSVSNVQSFMRVSGSRSYSGPVDLERLGFQIRDEFGRLLPGYNCDINLTLAVTFGSLAP